MPEEQGKLTLEQESSNPTHFIHPYSESSGTQTLTKLIHFLKLKSQKAEIDRNDKIRKYKYKSGDFYSIQEAMELVKFDASIVAQSKTLDALNDTLREMLDIAHNGKYKTGYLYPVLFGGENFSVKMLIMTCPESEAWLPTSAYRNLFIQFNKPIIKRYLSSFTIDRESSYYTDPFSFMIKRLGSTTEFNPYGLSILEKLNNNIKESFSPYISVPMNDFYTDVLEYCSEGTDSTIITKNYYIIKRELFLNHLGNPTNEPEVYFHYFSIFLAIEEIVVKEFLSLSDIYGLPVSKIKINQYIKKYPEPVAREPEAYAEKLVSLSEIIDGFVMSNRMTKEEKDLILSVGEGMGLLKAFEPELQKTENYLKESRQKKFIEILIQRIEESFEIKKTLYVYDVDRPFVESYESSKNTNENKIYVKKNLLSKYHFFESTTHDGRQYYYLLNPKHSLSILHNLAQLSKTNSSYVNQYKICKILREKMEAEYVPELDSGLLPTQKKMIQDEMNKFKEKEKKEALILERKKSYNSFLAQIVGATSIFILFYSYLYFQNIIPLILLPFSIGIAYKLGDIFRKKKKSFVEGNPNVSYTNIILSDSDSVIYNEIVKKIISSKKLEVKDRIMSKDSLKFIFQENIKKLKEEKPSFIEFSEEILLNNLYSAIEKFSMVIIVPKNLRFKNVPEKILLIKDHLKDNFIRAQMHHYCESLSKPDKSGKMREDAAFYKYLSIVLDHDFKGLFL